MMDAFQDLEEGRREVCDGGLLDGPSSPYPNPNSRTWRKVVERSTMVAGSMAAVYTRFDGTTLAERLTPPVEAARDAAT